MNYNEAINYLHELTTFGINLGLQRIERILEIMGSPHHGMKFIHIGGTNGKGSTSAMLTSILREGGYRVGTYTSPHLHSYTERIMINGQPISEKSFAQGLYKIKPIVEQVKKEQGDCPTEFEVLTALAIWMFFQENVDYVVWEVGMGGSIDSTNVVKPIVSVITNVSIDHTNYLGNNIQEIAEVKAGIIKKETPLVTAARDKNILEIFEKHAENVGSKILEVHKNISWNKISQGLEGQYFQVKSKKFDYGLIFLPLLGEHQQVNAATAILTIEQLMEKELLITKENIINGFKKVNWPGRLEIMVKSPIIIVDGAHNEEGAKSLADSLNSIFPEQKITFVIGILEDKERVKILNHIIPLANELIITKPPGGRAKNWDELENIARGRIQQIAIIEDVNAAIAHALHQKKPSDIICVTGSLYLLDMARLFILDKYNRNK